MVFAADDCTLARRQQRAAQGLEGPARVARYERIAELCTDFGVLYNLGRAYQGVDDHQRALASFRRALAVESVEPRYRAFASARRAESLLGLGRLAEALAAIEVAEQTVGGDPPGFFADVRRRIDAHPRRDRLTAAELDRVFGLLGKSYGVVPRIDVRFHFAFDRAMLTDEGRDQVARVAQALQGYARGYAVELIGHTNVRGDAAYNQVLSERRADAVLRALLDTQPALRGRVSARGMGERQPLYPGTNAEDHRRNRRVEVILHP